jgi:uncharacterized protein (TIGR03067 family)
LEFNVGTSLLLGLAIVVGAPGAKDPPKKEPTIVGVWIGEKAVRDGKDRPVPEGGIVFTFAADGKLNVKEGNREPKEGATYKLDAKKSPGEIDIIPPEGKDEPTIQGIFKIEGETLTICISGPSAAGRPTKFESAEGSQTMLMILKRAKKE